MTKRNAKRQLAAIYANSGERRLRHVGGKGSRRSRSPLKCPYTYHVERPALNDKDRAAANAVIERVKTALLGSYTPLALCHFIKTNKPLIFNTPDVIKIKTKCIDVGKAMRIMRTYYERLNIDSVTAHTSPKIPLTLDKKMVNTILSTPLSIQSRSSVRQSPRLLQTGGQERPRQPITPLSAAYFMLGQLAALTFILLLSFMDEDRRMNREIRGFRDVWDEEVLHRIPHLLLVSVLFMGGVALDEHFYFANRDNDRVALDEHFLRHDDRVALEHLRGRVAGIGVYLAEGQQDPVPVNSFKIIKQNSDMPHVPENLNTCGICTELLVQPDPNVPLKNLHGYIVQLHPGEGPVPHLYHFKCIRGWFEGVLRRMDNIPTTCPLDGIAIAGSNLVGMVPDELVESYFTSADGMHFFHNASPPPPPPPPGGPSHREINDKIDREYEESLRIDRKNGLFGDDISPRTPHPASGAAV